MCSRGSRQEKQSVHLHQHLPIYIMCVHTPVVAERRVDMLHLLCHTCCCMRVEMCMRLG
jgi:hypothetical protein